MYIHLTKAIKIESSVILLGFNERYFSIVKNRILHRDRHGRQYFTFQNARYYLDELHRHNIRIEEWNGEV